MKDSKNSLTRRDALKQGAIASGALIMGGAVGTAGAKPGKDKKCEVVVPEDYNTIQEAVDNAESGDTICVRAGTYSEIVSVNKAVTVKGVNDPDGSDAAEVDGSIEVSADNATVSRLKVAPKTTFVADGLDPLGILVGGDLSDVSIKGNIVEGMTADSTGGSVTINGIQLWNDGPNPQTGTEVKNNTVRDMDNMGDAAAGWPNYGGAAAIKVQGVVKDTVVAGNTVEGVHSAGWTYGIVTTHTKNAPGISPTNTTVEMNTIEEVNDGSVYDVFGDAESAPYPGSAFAIDGDSLASEATVHLNNFLQTPIGALNKDVANTLDAKCNYWDHATGPEDEDNKKGKGTKAVGDIDYTPWNTRKVGRGENSENSCVGGKNADKGKKKGR